jgi:ornithine decarboxylase
VCGRDHSQPIHGSTIRFEFFGFVAPPSRDVAGALLSEITFERVPSLGRLEGAMTERIQEFLRNRRNEGQDAEPCLVVDLEVVRDNYQTFSTALPDSRVFYAVKANPAPEVLSLLASMGSCFDCASVAEIQMALAAGAPADRISYGNTIKRERDIARAFALGIRLFAVDCTAVAQVRLRSGDGGRGARSRQAPWPGALWHLVPCGLAAAQGEGVGSRVGDGLDRVP